MEKILVTLKIPIVENLEGMENFQITMPKEKFSRAEVIAMIEDYDYVIACQQKVDEELLDEASHLKAVNSYGVGYDSIDIEACNAKNILVTNTPNSVTEPTAEVAIGLMHAVSRRIAEIDRKMREDQISWGILKNEGVTLYKKSLGIIGLGRIGKAVARRAKAMGMDIYYYNRNRLSVEEEQHVDAKYMELDVLLGEMDCISLHTPLSDSSYHLIGKRELRLMKQDAILINTARGKVVDEIALIEALKEGQIYGAGLDVFEFEPKVSEALLTLDSVVLLPHIGTDTKETCKSMFVEAVESFIAISDNSKPSNLINTDIWKRRNA